MAAQVNGDDNDRQITLIDAIKVMKNCMQRIIYFSFR